MDIKFRKVSRAIAIIDLIMRISGCLFVVFAMFVYAFETGPISKIIENLINNRPMNHPDGDIWNSLVAREREAAAALIVAISWFLLILIAFICFLQLFGAFKLLKGTEQGTSPKHGLRNCRIWRGISIFFIVIAVVQIMLFLQTGNLSFLGVLQLIATLVHVVALLFVQQYMNGLQLSLQKFNDSQLESGFQYPSHDEPTKV